MSYPCERWLDTRILSEYTRRLFLHLFDQVLVTFEHMFAWSNDEKMADTAAEETLSLDRDYLLKSLPKTLDQHYSFDTVPTPV